MPPRQHTATISIGRQSSIPVRNLLLDEQNPRLASNGHPRSQRDLVRFLWTEMAVDELALSIANNGFFPEEPLFVIPRDPGHSDERTDKFIVVEGNRRLAAVLLLRDKALQEELAADVPHISSARRSELDSLPVSIHLRRRDLWQYFGFRHINGPKPWDAYSKAKYVASVYETYSVPLSKIADSIGDRHATVTRLYRGFKILQQAERSLGFSTDDRVHGRFFFSHLYTATDQPEFQRFLGISSDGSLKANPVPKSKLPHLNDLMTWLYGSKSKNKAPLVRTQNPDLNTLREVISTPRGLDALRIGLSLDRAREVSIGDKRRFRDALTRTKDDLQEAKATVTTGYSGEPDLFEMIEDIIPVAESIKSEMVPKRRRTERPRRQ